MNLLKIIPLLLFVVLMTTSVSALSCIPTSPQIGVVSEFELDRSNYRIYLENTKSFDTTGLRGENEISIDVYETIVNSYVQGEELKEIPDYLDDPNSLSIRTNVFEAAHIEEGDIIIRGPPFSVCSYGFTGIFSANGTLKQTIMSGSFSNYEYKNATIFVEPGNIVTCDKNDFCKVDVDYQFLNEKFTLSISTTYFPETNLIHSFTLIDSSNYKMGNSKQYSNNGKVLYLNDPWGFNKYAVYIITFSDELVELDCSFMDEPTQQDGCVYQQVLENGCIVDYEEVCGLKSKSLFNQVKWWFYSVFS